MRIVLLSDGDPDGYAAWSGITRSIVAHLRLDRHEVRTVDVGLTRIRRAWAAAMALSPNRDRWRAKYTLGRVSFQLRSERACDAVATMRQWSDCGVQIGATFNAFRRFDRPYFLCCDSNIKVAIRGRETGFSPGSVLRPGELDAVVRREAEVYQGAAGIFTLSERLRAVSEAGYPQVSTISVSPRSGFIACTLAPISTTPGSRHPRSVLRSPTGPRRSSSSARSSRERAVMCSLARSNACGKSSPRRGL